MAECLRYQATRQVFVQLVRQLDRDDNQRELQGGDEENPAPFPQQVPVENASESHPKRRVPCWRICHSQSSPTAVNTISGPHMAQMGGTRDRFPSASPPMSPT